MAVSERCDKCGSPSCCAHWRARATTGYDFVSLQRDEMRAERDTAREQLRGAVEAARGLARWTQHSPTCARHDTTAEDCTCGLDQAWAELEAR